VKKAAAAARLAKLTKTSFAELSSGNRRFAAWPWVARIPNPVPLLLKTASAPEKTRRFAGPTALSIAAALHPTQRGTLNSGAAESDSAGLPVLLVPTPAWCAKRNREDRNQRNAPGAKVKEEDRIFQNSHERENDTLYFRHIRCIETRRKSGSVRVSP
jgi:hypothetical protein